MCGKPAAVLFNGFSLCNIHHFDQLWKRKEQSVIDSIIDQPDYEDRLKELSSNAPNMKKKMMYDYATMFGEMNGKDNNKRR